MQAEKINVGKVIESSHKIKLLEARIVFLETKAPTAECDTQTKIVEYTKTSC